MFPSHDLVYWSAITRDASMTYGPLVVGGLILISILADSIQLKYLLAILLAWASFLLYVAQNNEDPISQHFSVDLALITGFVLLLNSFLIFSFFILGRYGGKVRHWLRIQLSPAEWQAEANSPTTHDRITRWFVAITSGTACAAFYQMTNRGFWQIVMHALRPTHIVYTVFLMLVPFVLVGPVEEYVLGFGSGERGGHHSPSQLAVQRLWENLSWRACGRLAVVVLVLFGLPILHASLDESYGSRHHGSGHHGLAAAGLVSLGLSAGILGFYWSAALYAGGRSIAKRACRGTALSVWILSSPAFFIFFMGIFLPLFTDGPTLATNFLHPWAHPSPGTLTPTSVTKAVFASLAAALIFSLALSAMVAVQAWLGAQVLTRGGKRLPLPALFFILGLTIAIPQIPLRAIVDQSWKTGIWVAFLTAAGTVVGLAFSGFPEIVTRGLNRQPGHDSPISASPANAESLS